MVELLGGAFLTLTVHLETKTKERRNFPFPALRFNHRFQQRPRNNAAIHFEAPPAFLSMLLFQNGSCMCTTIKGNICCDDVKRFLWS